jgi:tetratricopeptide (TPR) repeat protein
MGGQSDEAFERAYSGAGFRQSENNWNAVWTEANWAEGVQQLEGAERALRERGPITDAYIRDRLDPLKAMALAKLGRLDEARALVAQLGPDAYWAMVARGFIADAAGDTAGADRIFNDCVRKAPSVAWSYGYLSRLRLEHSDDDGAIAAAKAGLKPNPRFADLHQFWGEALLHKGDAKGAIAEFEKANDLTPKWARTHLKWGEALAKLGDAAGAKAQFALAARLDLSAAERAELAAQKV